ncbi:MAG: hypothetical protein CMO34_03950 [Verrucomicrobia bacterium]|nr:hypothetical protein [Verrucomicrobiota bacterium]|tara:strand:- start:3 stop:500 length:498 start_codon:yes stop_codon:yes gene_type:complete
MKKILLPTDFSKASDQVIAFALEAFNDEPCVFYFMHAYPYEVYGLDALCLLQQGEEIFKEADMKVFVKMVDQVSHFAKQEKYSKHFLKLICKDVELIKGIREVIKEFDIDILLIGTEGENPKTHQYKEKTVNKIVEEIKSCPVMTIPLSGEAWASMGLEDIKLAC